MKKLTYAHAENNDYIIVQKFVWKNLTTVMSAFFFAFSKFGNLPINQDECIHFIVLGLIIMQG